MASCEILAIRRVIVQEPILVYPFGGRLSREQPHDFAQSVLSALRCVVRLGFDRVHLVAYGTRRCPR
jgi:hypothetical protein